MQDAFLSLFTQRTIHELAGIVGVGFYVTSYLLLQTGYLRGVSYSYATMNLIGAFLMLYSLTVSFNLPSVMIEIIWIIISTYGIIRIYVINSAIRFNEEELQMIARALPEMPKPLSKQLLKRGVWHDVAPGAHLTREGEAVKDLNFLLTGQAKVFLAQRCIATISGGLIGEMNVMRGGAASATVTVTQPSRVFTISGKELQKMAAADTDFRAYLELHLSESTRSKLIEANKNTQNHALAVAPY